MKLWNRDIPDWVLTRAGPIGLLIILFSPRLVLLSCLVLAGFIGGVIVGGGINLNTEDTEAIKSDMDRIEEKLGKMELLTFERREEKDDRPLPPIDRAIEPALSRFVKHICADFVESWFSQINYSKSDEFTNSVEAAIRHGLCAFGAAASKTKVTTVASPVAQTIVRHIDEYRAFETAALPLQLYLERNPHSPFHKYADSKETNKFLRRISAHIVMSIMPKADRESPVVFSFLREIVATSVLGSLVETYSDPDYINKSLIEYVKEQQKAASVQLEALDSASPENVAGPKLNNIPKPVKSAVRSVNGDQLFLKIVEAKQMPLGQGSVFCRILFSGNELKTERIASETHPIWMEEFAFDWGPKMRPNDTIVVEIYDGRLIRDELIGTVCIPAKSLQPNVYSKEWYPIDTSESRIASSAFMAQVFIETMVISISNLDDLRPDSPTPAVTSAREVFIDTPRIQDQLDVLKISKPLPENDDFESAETLLSDSVETVYIAAESFLKSNIPFVEGLQLSSYKNAFSTYLDSLNASALLQLYTTIAALKPEISVDEAKNVFDIYFASPKLDSKVEETVIAALNSSIFDDATSDAKINSDLFIDVKEATLLLLSSFWDGFKSTDGFKNLTVADKLTEVVEVPVEPPAKPRRTTTISVAPPPLPPRDTDAKPLVPRESTPAPSPPSLPARITESEALQQKEEEDLKLAVALQQEEYRLAASLSAETTADRTSIDIVSKTSSSKQVQSSEYSPNSEFSATFTSNPIISEISTLKERIAMIEQKLQNASDDVVGQELLCEKLELQADVERLSETLRDNETESGPSVNLLNASIRINDVTDDSLLNERINIADRLLFCIEVQPVSNSSGWVLTKTLTDFTSLYDALSSEFLRVKRSAYPGLFFRTNMISNLQPHERIAVARDLESWTRDLLSDSLISQSFAVMDLLQPEHLKHKSTLRKKSGGASKRTESVSGSVFGVLKSAGSVLKNVAVSTGNAINNIGSSATPPPQFLDSSFSRPGNWEMKLQQRRDTGGLKASNLPSRSSSLGKSVSPKGVSVSGYSSLATETHSDDEAASEKTASPAVAPGTREKSASDTPNRRTTSANTVEEQPQQPLSTKPRSRSKSPSPLKTDSSLQPPAVTIQPPVLPPRTPSDLSPSELAILLECAFGVIEEVFNLSDPNQWMRQRGLQVVKSVLRNSYGVTISTMIRNQVDEIRSVEAVSGYLDSISNSLWPNGVWAYSTPEYLAQLELDKLNPRTDTQRAETRIEAKKLLNNNSALLGYDGIQTVLGKQNTNAGVSRLFNMLQHRELNKGLICAVLEAVVRSVLAEH
ncbi:UNVERIFIED_CONTAM: sorting nexin 13 [Siphonaria sp. JEL0065]|nr:sorting nexin 13 [Siphonaria sp. JEL0065]